MITGYDLNKKKNIYENMFLSSMQRSVPRPKLKKKTWMHSIQMKLCTLLLPSVLKVLQNPL